LANAVVGQQLLCLNEELYNEGFDELWTNLNFRAEIANKTTL
jgi:hypothetical protein